MSSTTPRRGRASSTSSCAASTPARSPKPLHWFKWQAYTTWLSGMVLLIVLYWLGSRAALTDPSIAHLSHGQAALVSGGSIVVGWFLYESMNRFVAPRAPAISATLWITGLIVISIGLTRLLSGRAAFLHVGAM